MLLLLLGPAAAAQVLPAEERPPLPELAEPEGAGQRILPALDAQPARGPTPSGDPVFVARGFRVVGSSVFSEEELAADLAAYIGGELRSEDLAAIRDAVTQRYVDAGYVTSGALIPDQDPAGGVITVQVVEGALQAIEVAGETRFRESRLRDRLALGLRRPLDVAALRLNLELLQQDPRIERVHAQLLPTERLGEALLRVRVEEASPWNLDLQTSNHAPVAFGAYRGRIEAGHSNVTGIGDVLSARFSVAEGLLRVTGQYEFPLTARGTTLKLRGDWSTSEIVEAPFDALDIDTDYASAGFFLEHPVYRSRRAQLTLGLMGEWRRSKTCLGVLKSLIGCDPFSFLQSGAVNGETVVSVLRATQEWTWRDRRQVVAARSIFSFGLPVLGARGSGVAPDGEFFAWLGQLQWARRHGSWGVQTILRADAQFASDGLPSLERFPVGGHATVRGYRENQLVRDQGVVASAELRIPLWRDESRPVLEVAPFFDIGWSENVNRPTPSPGYLASVGLGLRWAITRRIRAEAYWGHRIESFIGEGDLQDEGVQFLVTWDAF